MLLEKILEKIKKTPEEYQAYEDLYGMCQLTLEEDQSLAVDYLVKLSDCIEKALSLSEDVELMRELYALHKKVLLSAAPYNFHCYLLYTEWNREPKAKFYPPRKKRLRPIVEALQKLADGDLDLLAISLPPGSGKSTLAIFYLTWMAGKFPNEPMLTGSHSNSWVRGAYDECLRMMDAHGDYLWHDVFPGLQISGTNAKDCRIDVDRRKRFETLEFTSVGTGNAGLYRASRLLYCDDLVPSIEVALSKERLDKLWEQYTTDLRQRKIGDHCAELHIATRWSVHDVIGRLEQQYEDNPRAEFIVIPAMDENDESNFDYSYGVGFSTDFYREQRAIMDDASWRALYMNQPIEREGLVYHEDELRRFFDLPDGEPDAIISVCDTKDKGSDDCVMPVGFVYGQDHYIFDCICDNSLPDIVDARLVDCLIKNKVQMSRFESNNAGGRVAKDVQATVKAKGGITNITTKYTTSNKETKIITNSGWVKEHCLFLDESCYKRKSDYGKLVSKLCSYTMMGKNKHDDVPDAMAQYAEFAQSLGSGKVEVFNRPW